MSQIGNQWAQELSKNGIYLISQMGILKHIFSPIVLAENIVTSKKVGVKSRMVNYAKGLANDTIEVATRATVALSTTLDNLQGKTNHKSKFSNAPKDFYEGISQASRQFKRGHMGKGITTTLLGLQNSIDPEQALRRRKRYKNHSETENTIDTHLEEWVTEF
jgi:hypothetical protein